MKSFNYSIWALLSIEQLICQKLKKIKKFYKIKLSNLKKIIKISRKNIKMTSLHYKIQHLKWLLQKISIMINNFTKNIKLENQKRLY